MKFKYELLDMDGTLLDTMPYWRNLIPIFAKINGLEAPQLDEKILNHAEQMETYDGIAYLKKISKNEAIQKFQPNDAFTVMEYCYKNHSETIAGVLETLKRFKNNGIRMCCASATPTRLVEIALKNTGIREYFDFILSPDDYPKVKTSPELFEGAAKRFGCELKEMALFDDAVYNLRTSSKLGLYTVGVEERYSLVYKDEIKAICNEYITSLAKFKLD